MPAKEAALAADPDPSTAPAAAATAEAHQLPSSTAKPVSGTPEEEAEETAEAPVPSYSGRPYLSPALGWA